MQPKKHWGVAVHVVDKYQVFEINSAIGVVHCCAHLLGSNVCLLFVLHLLEIFVICRMPLMIIYHEKIFTCYLQLFYVMWMYFFYAVYYGFFIKKNQSLNLFAMLYKVHSDKTQPSYFIAFRVLKFSIFILIILLFFDQTLNRCGE